MKIDCKIKSIGELRSGVNAQTGNNWHFLPVEIEWQEVRNRNDGTTYVIQNTLVTQVTGEHAKNFNLPVGQTVTIDVRFTVEEYQGRQYNSIRSSFIVLR